MTTKITHSDDHHSVLSVVVSPNCPGCESAVLNYKFVTALVNNMDGEY